MTRRLQRWIAPALVLAVAGCAIAPGSDRTAIQWQVEFEESGSQPVLADGVLYVGSGDGAVHAFDATTGQARWRFQTGESIPAGPTVITAPGGGDSMGTSMGAVEERRRRGYRRVDMTPAVENGTVFVGSGDESFYAIDAATGRMTWSYAAGPGMSAGQSVTIPAAVLRNGTVYFVTEDGLHALDALTGKRKWLFETLEEIPIEQMNSRTKRVPEGPALGDSVIFLTAWPFPLGSSAMKSFVYAVDPESGKAKWTFSADGLFISKPTTAKGLVFLTIQEPAPLNSDSRRATVYALDAVDGQVAWKRSAEQRYYPTRLLIADDTLYFRTDKSLLALEPETGRQLWSFSADEIHHGLWADDQQLYVVTSKGSLSRPKDTLHALALSTGKMKWSHRVGGGLSGIATIHEAVIYASGERLHAIDAATGKPLWSFEGTGRESAWLISEGRIILTSPTTRYLGTTRVDQGYLTAIDARTGMRSTDGLASP